MIFEAYIIDGLVLNYNISIDNALELPQSCTKALIIWYVDI